MLSDEDFYLQIDSHMVHSSTHYTRRNPALDSTRSHAQSHLTLLRTLRRTGTRA